MHRGLEFRPPPNHGKNGTGGEEKRKRRENGKIRKVGNMRLKSQKMVKIEINIKIWLKICRYRLKIKSSDMKN